MSIAQPLLINILKSFQPRNALISIINSINFEWNYYFVTH
jgi:hypothetical protein